MAIVYAHKKKSNDEVFYIGISTNYRRPYQVHSSQRSDLWLKYYNKYGRTVEIIEEDVSWEQACELEMFLIELIGRVHLNTGPLVNLTAGGDEGSTGYKFTDKQRKNLSDAHIGQSRPHTEETKEKIRISNTGKKITGERLENMRLVGRRPVAQYTPSGEFIATFNSLKEAGELTGISNATIGSVARHRKHFNTAGGYVWKYA